MFQNQPPVLLCKKGALKSFVNFARNTCNGVSFLIKLQLCNFIKKRLQYIHSNLLVLKFGTMVHLVQWLKFWKIRCTFDQKINVKIAFLFPKDYGVMTQVHDCSGQLCSQDLAFSRKRTYFKTPHLYKCTINNQSRRSAFK